MTSDLSATLERVRAALECHPYGRLVCYAGDHVLAVADLRELLAALARLQEERDAFAAEVSRLSLALQQAGKDGERLETIVTKRLTIAACDACQRDDGEYRICVSAPSGAGHCNPATLEGIRDGIDAALTMHPNHFAARARDGGTA